MYTFAKFAHCGTLNLYEILIVECKIVQFKDFRKEAS